jgi:hypothetical protein
MIAQKIAYFAALFAIPLMATSAAPTDQPLPTDEVRDAATAIEIGKAACGDYRSRHGGKWMATYANRIWTVEWDEKAGIQAPYSEIVHVRADTGMTGSVCGIIVTAR